MFRNFILTQVSEFCSNFRLQISYAKSYPVQNIPLYLRLICFLNYNCLELMKEPFIHFIYFMSNILQLFLHMPLILFACKFANLQNIFWELFIILPPYIKF